MVLHNSTTYLQGKQYTLEVVKVIADYAIVKFGEVKAKLSSLKCHHIHLLTGDRMEVEMPWYNGFLVSAVNNKSQIQTKKAVIKRRLFNNLMYRLMINKCTTKSLLSYAQTLASTYSVSNRGTFMTHHVNIPQFLLTTYFASFYYEM